MEKLELKKAGSESKLVMIPQFKANPMPKTSSVLIYDKKVEEEELAR
jgi:hypothetical protein